MRQQTLFEKPQQDVPLATRMRPRTLDEFVGQTHLLGEGKVLRQLIEEDRVSSMIFWGPPGVGKTTLARIIAGRTKANFINFSAVTSGIKEIREVMNEADRRTTARRAHAAVHRRDPPLQQSAAGRLPAVCGKGQHRAHRRDDGKPVVRGQRRAFVPLQGVRPAGAFRGGACGASAPALKDPRGFGGQTVGSRTRCSA
jgi:hypothetical protein